MICKSCGHNVPDGSRFCTRCGTSLAEAPAPVFAPDPVPVTIPEPVPVVAEPAPVFVPEAVTEPVPVFVPEAAAEPVPVFVPETVAEPVPVFVPEAVAEPIPTFPAEPAPVFSAEPVPVFNPAPMVAPVMPPISAAPVSTKRYEYKVLSQKDAQFSGKFDPTALEEALNTYAQQGWRVVGCANADVPGFTASRPEFITLLEREI